MINSEDDEVELAVGIELEKDALTYEQTHSPLNKAIEMEKDIREALPYASSEAVAMFLVAQYLGQLVQQVEELKNAITEGSEG